MFQNKTVGCFRFMHMQIDFYVPIDCCVVNRDVTDKL